MSEHFEQLPLALRLADDATFANFYVAGANQLLADELQRQAQGGGEQWLYIHGRAGSGRSHLLQACCHLADARGAYARYLPVAELLSYRPEELLESAESLDLLCLDDIDRALGNPDWERALFNCYNRLLASGTAMLVAAEQPVLQLSCQLPDLRSRLSGFSVLQVHPLNDEERVQALQFRGRCLGIELPDEVADYIYVRCQRDLGHLFAVLDTLDRQSLAKKRKLTIPFVKTAMGW